MADRSLCALFRWLLVSVFLCFKNDQIANLTWGDELWSSSLLCCLDHEHLIHDSLPLAAKLL